MLVNLLRRVGKVGEPFLGNVFKDHIITNIQGFFGLLAKKHSASNIAGSELVKPSISGRNIAPRVTRSLVAPTSRLENWQRARDRRKF